MNVFYEEWNSLKNKIKYHLSGVKKKWTYENFLYYKMQGMTKEERNEILSIVELEKFERRFNSDDSRDVFNKKSLFYKWFHSFMHRDILFLENASREEYLDFLKKHSQVIIKPDDMYAGIGIECGESKIFVERFEELKAKRFLMEEYLEQEEHYRQIYAGSLNTIRVNTLIKKDGSVEVFAAANQFGSNGSITDNDDITGIWANIDVNTGIVNAVEINPLNSYVNDLHPDTQMPILGFCNIQFDKVKEVACKAAKIVPECRLIGWDICITKNGEVEIIEGNVTPELDLYQAISGKGFRSYFEQNI